MRNNKFFTKVIAIVIAILMCVSALPSVIASELNADAAETMTTSDCAHKDEVIPAVETSCAGPGFTEGLKCALCGEVFVAPTEIPALDHDIEQYEAKAPTYTDIGWDAYEACLNCDYSTFLSIPALGEPEIDSYEEFLINLAYLEEIASLYVETNPGKDPVALVIKYIRTGVDRYNSGSWGIMAGNEDAGFAKFVKDVENSINAELPEGERLEVTGLKNINNFTLPNGNKVDFGHMFGMMDIAYHNNGSENHADVGGWAGDLVDLLSQADRHELKGSVEEMVKEISEKYLCVYTNESDAFGPHDMYGDLDGYYMIEALKDTDYYFGAMTEIMMGYFTEELDDVDRAEFFLKNRLDGVSTRTQVRNAVYNAYTSNKVISTLEGTREFLSSDLSDMRRACCYAFADYICRLAGDFVDVTDNPYYSNFNTTTSILAPGVTQEINYATSVDGKQMIYYLATADLTRDDVDVYANYNNNDPTEWAMSRVLDQANAAQQKYGNPDSEHYIENYNVIASINGDGYNMATGEPGGLLVMKGVEYHKVGNGGFFAILKDGTAMIGTKAEYEQYKSQIQEGIGGFGTRLVQNGKICIDRTDSYFSDRAPRTAVGITKTGKVVFMVLDGRQEPRSCGGSMEEIAQIMLEAGCVEAVNLDGGGSTTFVSRQEGSEELAVLNSPSDGGARSVSTSLMIVSTAPSSTAFDHARLDTEFDYATVGTPVQITPVGISATGNIAEIPEGCTWAVSNSRWGTVTEDGVFTGLRNGSVDVYLMNGETIVGVKTMTMVTPTNIYFTRDTMDAVYGEKVLLPVAGAYSGKRVAISPEDVAFSMNAAAGTIDGFYFVGNVDSGVRAVKITASLATDEYVAGTITLNLYRQGENSFDFDQATGGDRLLAYDRVVTNATTTDNITYVAVDTNEDMVTSYTFAMDMTQIPIPPQLQDLVYMLPGADMENASAWNFLLQLAERVSVLTEVKPVIKFDSDLDVDYSELKILTDYFELTATEFDESTNTLTMTLNWIDRTTAIDPATANSLCLVTGIKLTPKDGANWDTKNRLSIVNSGEISYKIYLRANALYSFAIKPENQQIYGLQPFVNPNIPSESGAYFSDIYKKFDDTYTLENALKNGWYSEEGGFAYYEQGVKYYDVREVDGFFYDFGSNGINVGQNKYTGIFYDPKVGNYCYAKAGVLSKGWQLIDGNWHYFNYTDGGAVSGRNKVGDIYYNFDSKGKILDGAWIHTLEGVRYYYGPSYYTSRWQEIDGNMYYFRNGYRVTGYSEVVSQHDSTINEWHDFGNDGIDRGFVPDGMVELNGRLYNIVNGRHVYGLAKHGDDYYFFNYSGDVIKNQEFYAWATNCDLPCGTYNFGADGKMLQGVVYHDDGSIMYYENGKTGTCGLIQWEGDYYYVYWGGVVKTGKQYASVTYCDLPVGEYLFGDDGKMLQGIVYHDDGSIIYYVNGKTGTCGLIEWEGDYYYVYWGGVVKTGKQYASITYCDLPKGEYLFGDDGKMLQGVVYHDDGSIIYYENGKTGTCGLIEWEGDYYYVYWGGVVKTGKQYVSVTYCDLPVGEYLFGDDGKMLQGVVYHDDGSIIYYENGKTGTCGLIQWEGDYYYVYWGGVVKTGSQYVSVSYCDLPLGTYEFGADGKMLDGFVEKDGQTLYYKNGRTAPYGLTLIDGDYYYVYWGGVIKTGKQYVSSSLCDLPAGEYVFGDDGKLLDGFVNTADGLYYYTKGKADCLGLIILDGYFYFIATNGRVVTNQTYYVWKTNDLVIEKNYVFDELGRIIA